jgi:hypothetical protein
MPEGPPGAILSCKPVRRDQGYIRRKSGADRATRDEAAGPGVVLEGGGGPPGVNLRRTSGAGQAQGRRESGVKQV